MQVIVGARNTDISSIRNAIDIRVKRLRRFEPRASKAEFVFTGQRNEVRATVVISIDRGRALHGEATGPDPRTALDKLTTKIGNQMRRRRGQRWPKRHRRRSATA